MRCQEAACPHRQLSFGCDTVDPCRTMNGGCIAVPTRREPVLPGTERLLWSNVVTSGQQWRLSSEQSGLLSGRSGSAA